MRRILLVAQREFVTTISNKGFLFGLLIMPALIGLAVLIGPRILAMRSPQVVGRVAVVDPTGQVLPRLRNTLSASAIEARREEDARRAAAIVPGAEGPTSEAVRRAIGTVPDLTVVERPADADLGAEKRWLSSDDPQGRPLAVVVVDQKALAPDAGGGEYGTFSLYAARALDGSTESALYDAMREALVGARLASAQLDQERVEAMLRVRRPESVVVTAEGERATRRQFMRVLPLLVGVLLFVGVLMGGQSLMTSTIEEKSSRVVEVLLSAISPFELMAGKLLGQLGVGLLTLAVYLGLGVLGLYSFAMLGLIDPMLIVYFLVFFTITYAVFGALMMSIGAAVNQMNEAQSLMGPVMLLLILPYLLSPIIGSAPNSPLSVALSFIPPINTFAMMTRMASDSPPPAWQVWLTVPVGIAAAVAAIWFAGKVFKIGLLMHGKPPNVRTLLRWAKQA